MFLKEFVLNLRFIEILHLQVESGGSVLSTNWGEVGKDKVDVKPPDGMEWKKWDA